MAASRLAALQARIKAKQDVKNGQTEERLAELRKEDKEKDIQEAAERREAAQKRAVELAAKKAEELANPPKKQKVDTTVMCRCGLEAKAVKVKKEGPNLGKTFYACTKPQADGSQCKFFQWATPEQEQTPQDGAAPAAPGVDAAKADAPPQGIPLCRCSPPLPAKELCVRKEGPNMNRKFYKCASPGQDSDRCSFFQWAPEADGAAEAREEANKPKMGYDENGRLVLPPAKRALDKQGVQAAECFKCGGSGHYARDCNASKEASAFAAKPKKDPSTSVCYKCKQLGHFSNDCPQTEEMREEAAIAARADGYD